MKQTLVFLSFLFLIACEEDDFSYSGKYVSENSCFSDVKVYTSNGEITDASIIRQIVLNRFPGEFILNTDTVLEAGENIELEFLSGEKALLNYRYIAEQRNIKEKGGLIYIESEDIYLFYNSDYETISDKIFKYQPLYSNSITMPSSSGYLTKTEFKDCLYLLGNKSKIKVPFLTYVLVRHPSQDNIQVEAGINNNNSFNDKALDYLIGGDTLIVQEYFTKMVKQ